MGKIIFFITLLGMTHTCCYSQLYQPVTHLSGTQNVNGRSVTVTPSPTGSSSYLDYCGLSPYWIGLYGPDIFVDNPGSYTFAFIRPVAAVRIRLSALDPKEIVSFTINGVPYILTAANLSVFTGNCNQSQAIIVGGNLECPPGTQPGDGHGGEVNISGPIDSIKVHANGEENGTVFSMAFLGYGLDVSSNSPVCQGDTLKFFVVPPTTGVNYSYSWTGPGGFSSNVQNPMIPIADLSDGGVYTATATSTTDTLTGSTSVTIIPLPVTKIDYNQPLCAGSDLLLSDTSTFPGLGYNWQGPNGFSSSDPRPVIPNMQQSNAGLYTLTLTTNPGGCSYMAEAAISVLQPSHFSFTKAICPYEFFFFNNISCAAPGTYYDTLRSANSCDSIITLNLVALPVPEVVISVNQDIPLCIGDSILCIANGADDYQWYRDGRVLGNGDRELIYLPNLSNKVTVVGKSMNGCLDSTVMVVHTNPCCELFAPNAFTPNADGTNDGYGPESNGNFNGYQMSIFNRWGQEVFTTFNLMDKWNGTYKGLLSDAGTYFYYIRAKCLDGRELVRKGDVVLLR